MANAPSPSAPRSLAVEEKPYIVRVEVVELEPERILKETIILSKDVETFTQCSDAIEFAQKMWRKFSVR